MCFTAVQRGVSALYMYQTNIKHQNYVLLP
jgi:hypothetical protein